MTLESNQNAITHNQMTFTTKIDIGEESDIEVEVEFTYDRGCRGSRDSLGGKAGAGPPLEPDEPPSCVIDTITRTDTNSEIDWDTLSGSTQEFLDQKAFESLPVERDYEPPEPPDDDDFERGE